MKKIFYILIGMLIMSGIVYAADALIPASSIGYESEYTEKTNVADAMDELLNQEANKCNFELKRYEMPIMASASQDGVSVEPSNARALFDGTYYSAYWSGSGNLYFENIGVGGVYTMYLTLPKKMFINHYEIPKLEWTNYGVYSPSKVTIYGKLEDGTYKQICNSNSLSDDVGDIGSVMSNMFDNYKIEFTSPSYEMVIGEMRLSLYG